MQIVLGENKKYGDKFPQVTFYLQWGQKQLIE